MDTGPNKSPPDAQMKVHTNDTEVENFVAQRGEDISKSSKRSASSKRSRSSSESPPRPAFANKKRQDIQNSGTKGNYRSKSLGSGAEWFNIGSEISESNSFDSERPQMFQRRGFQTSAQKIRHKSTEVSQMQQQESSYGPVRNRMRAASSVGLPTGDSVELNSPRIETVKSESIEGGISDPEGPLVQPQELPSHEEEEPQVKQEEQSDEDESNEADLFNDNVRLTELVRQLKKEKLEIQQKHTKDLKNLESSKTKLRAENRDLTTSKENLVYDVGELENKLEHQKLQTDSFAEQFKDLKNASLKNLSKVNKTFDDEADTLRREKADLAKENRKLQIDLFNAGQPDTNVQGAHHLKVQVKDLKKQINDLQLNQIVPVTPAGKADPTIVYKSHKSRMPDITGVKANYETLYNGQSSDAFKSVSEKDKAIQTRITKIETADFASITKIDLNTSKYAVERVAAMMRLKVAWHEQVKRAVGAVPAELIYQFFDKGLEASRHYWSIDDSDKPKYRPFEPLCIVSGEWEPVFDDKFASAIYDVGMSTKLQNDYRRECLDGNGAIRLRGFDGAVGRMHWLFIRAVYDGREGQRRDLIRSVTSPHFTSLKFSEAIEEWITGIERVGFLLNYLRIDISELATGFREIAKSETFKNAGFLADARTRIKQIGQMSGPAYYTSFKTFGDLKDLSNVELLIHEMRDIIDLAIDNECGDFKIQIPAMMHHTQSNQPTTTISARLTETEELTTDNANASARQTVCPPAAKNEHPSRYEPRDPLSVHEHYIKLCTGSSPTHAVTNIFQWSKDKCPDFSSGKGCAEGAICKLCHVVLSARNPSKPEHVFCGACGQVGHNAASCINLRAEECRPKKRAQKKYERDENGQVRKGSNGKPILKN